MNVFKAGATIRAASAGPRAYKSLIINIQQAREGERLEPDCEEVEKIKEVVSSRLEMLLNTPVEISSGEFAQTNFNLHVKIPNVIEVEAGTVNVSDYRWDAVIPDILSDERLLSGYRIKVAPEEKYGK